MTESLAQIMRTIESYEDSEFIKSVVILEQSRSLFKARLQISRDIFIQVYANERSAIYSYTLIWQDRRMFGKDFLHGAWHTHTFENPEDHDESDEGRTPTTLNDFILAAIGLAIEHLL